MWREHVLGIHVFGNKAQCSCGKLLYSELYRCGLCTLARFEHMRSSSGASSHMLFGLLPVQLECTYIPFRFSEPPCVSVGAAQPC